MPNTRKPRWSSQMATVTAPATTTMNRVFQASSVTRTSAIRTRALAIESGTLRPARPWSWADAGVSVVIGGLVAGDECSHLEQLGLLVPEQLVDGVGVLLGRRLQALLGTGHVVLSDLTVLLHPLELLLGVAAQVAHRDAALLGLVPRDLDVLLAPLLGELREDATDDLAVVGRVHVQVGVADRALDVAEGVHVVRRDQDHPRVLSRERGEALEGGRGPVVVDHDLA